MYIEARDIKRILIIDGVEYKETVWEKVIDEIDQSKIKKISYKEFEKVMLELI